MLISLDLDNETPLYEQLCNQIIIGIATGELAEREKLPTVRQLADDLGINAMTVNKAYALLKQEGYIAIDRRHGAKVNARQRRKGDSAPEAELEEKLELLIAQATIRGVDQSCFQQLCARIFSKMSYQL
ncbi:MULTISPECIES: GntR family transcriptional regulator [Paenibacillus]|uniref:GntR family transcriptional regulator n=1 Tax=Paenibacillus TaxID=44249 RepID=UPI002FE0AB3D